MEIGNTVMKTCRKKKAKQVGPKGLLNRKQYQNVYYREKRNNRL